MEYPQARTESPSFQVGRNICATKKPEQPQRTWWPTGKLPWIWWGTASSQAGSTGLSMGYCSGFAYFLSRCHPLCSVLCYVSLPAGLKVNPALVPTCHWHSVRYMSCIYLDCACLERGFLKLIQVGSVAPTKHLTCCTLFQVKFQAVLSFSKTMNSLWQQKLGCF